MPIDEILDEIPNGELIAETPEEDEIIKYCLRKGFFIGILNYKNDFSEMINGSTDESDRVITKIVPAEYANKIGKEFVEFMLNKDNFLGHYAKNSSICVLNVINGYESLYFGCFKFKYGDTHVTESFSYFDSNDNLSKYIHKRKMPDTELFLPVVEISASVNKSEDIEYAN
jgi:hypothetical protein